MPQFIKPLRSLRNDKPAVSSTNGKIRYTIRSAGIPLKTLADLRLKVVSLHTKARRSSRLDVSLAVRDLRICVVHDHRCLANKAGVEQQALSMARLEHVEIDSDVRISEPLAPKR